MTNLIWILNYLKINNNYGWYLNFLYKDKTIVKNNIIFLKINYDFTLINGLQIYLVHNYLKFGVIINDNNNKNV